MFRHVMRRVSPVILLASVFLVLITTPLLSQDPDLPQDPEPAEPIEEVDLPEVSGNIEDEGPCDDSALDSFLFMIGQWHVDSRFRLADGSWDETADRATVDAKLGGCVLLEEYTGTRDQDGYLAESVFAYDPRTQVLQKMWIDSENGYLMLFEGNDDGEQIVLDASATIDGRRHLYRHIYYNIGGRFFQFEFRQSTDGGNVWYTISERSYRRIEDVPEAAADAQ